ncbi:S53 family peptidase [Streptacidiphilus cavernicola]|uniref:Protease pro-enzyme activation domain-containing protein n=1 Tax=Streptacidiphilus cavernicola TaxID=3342716 RepID=A0ABV6VW79_9ACTN
MTDQVTAAESSRIDEAAPKRAATGPGRRLGRTGVIAVAATAALLAGTIAAGATPLAGDGAGGHGASASATPQRLGAVPHPPKGAVRIGATPADTAVKLSVGLVPRDEQALKDFITATTTKGNAQYHHYLAKGQFASVFGPTPDTVAKVTAALRAEGLKPGKVSADGLAIPVTTTLAKAAQVFSTGFTSYRLSDGSTGFVNTAAPQVSGSIAADLSGITGLDTVARRQTMNSTAAPSAGTGTSGTGADTGTTVKRPDLTTGGPQLCGGAVTALAANPRYKGATDGNGYLSAATLADTYGMDHTGTSGAGITVGVLELENFSSTDLAAYQACYGTHVTVTKRTVDGGPKEPVYPAKIGGKVTENGIESLLDLEDIASLAPGVKIIAYQGVDVDKATEANWLHTYQAMVTDDTAPVLSISWGSCEKDTPLADIQAEGIYNEEAAAQGQTILSSSGDDGATTCINDTGSSYQNVASVSDPASQPYVTGVGGTTLSGGSTGSAATKRSAWGIADSATVNGEGSGGGTSAVWSMPNAGNFQSGFTGSGFSSTACKHDTGYTCRQVPDVSADADPHSGYPVYYGGAWQLIGGTSGASPTWAALLAIASAQPACQAGGRLGLINYALYQAARDDYTANFTDITTGNNKAFKNIGFNAGPGYDLATGLGEPKAAALSATLCAGLTPAATGPGTFHSVAPTRLLDTRNRSGNDKGPLPASSVSGVQIEGNKAIAGVPATGVTAVVLNVTVTQTSSGGFLTAWGDNTPRPTTSNLNWVKGQTVSNLVTVAVPGDGAIDFLNSAPAQVIADVQGYYTADTSGQTFTGLSPQRLMDTRTNHKTALQNATVSLPVSSGSNPRVPAGATAVVLNLTAVNTVNAGYLEAWPELKGSKPPTVSNVNWSASKSVQAGLAVVPIGSDGNVSIMLHGTGQFIADVFGYYTPNSSGKAFNATTPTRILDTRAAVGIGTKTPIAGGQTVKLQVVGSPAGVPAGAKAVVLNVTVANVVKGGFLTAWADGSSTPNTSNLNWWAAGQAMPNQVIVPIGADGKVDLKVSSSAAVIADVFGYFN